jgi:hypothetical protein
LKSSAKNIRETACEPAGVLVQWPPKGLGFPQFAFFKEGHRMSRVAAPPQTQPTGTQTPPVRIPHEKIAMRAYEKWCQKGRKDGTQLQDWLEAEAELKTEFARTATPTTTRR